jgi:hypothetical protein
MTRTARQVVLGLVAASAMLTPVLAAEEPPSTEPDVATGQGRAQFTVLTMFGDERVGSCPFRFRLRSAPGSGALLLSHMKISDSGGPGCGDFRACGPAPKGHETPSTPPPWTGRVDASSSKGSATIAMCFDTCFGRFEGPTRVSVQTGPAGIERIRARGAPVGLSGLEISGSWPLRPHREAGDVAPRARRLGSPLPSAGTTNVALSSE